MKVCYPELWFRHPTIPIARGYFDSYIGHAKKGGAWGGGGLAIYSKGGWEISQLYI